MSTNHTVRDGEYLASIAASYGFADYITIWTHSQNASLKAQRKNPNTLFPGDVVFIPDRETMECSAVTEKRHQFLMKQSPLRLRIVVKDEDDQPIANASCKLTVEGETCDLTTDGNGLLEQQIPPTAHEGTLLLKGETAAANIEIPIKIGYLHPLEETTGVQARLNNLGYNAGEVGGEDMELLRSAVEEFQIDHGLTPDGKWGPSFQAKLKEVYGC